MPHIYLFPTPAIRFSHRDTQHSYSYYSYSYYSYSQLFMNIHIIHIPFGTLAANPNLDVLGDST